MNTLLDLWTALHKGGIVMAALAALSVLLYKSLFSATRIYRRTGSEYAAASSSKERKQRLASLRREIARRLRFARVLIVAAPLLGLLGTVVGMLDTFKALSGNKTLSTTQSVADGISVALVTTEAGLVVAIPALFLAEWIRRRSLQMELSLFQTLQQRNRTTEAAA